MLSETHLALLTNQFQLTPALRAAYRGLPGQVSPTQPKVAALYVARNGTYWNKPGIDAWDQVRDARTYAGQLPVVAHPPCQLWVNFAALNYKRYGGEHNKPGNDGGCFAAALAAVRRCGGVLEHPAFSNAWDAHGLLRPTRLGWNQASDTEWTCEVWQSAYGHPARKRTWLLYVGQQPPIELNWSRLPGTHQVGWFDRIKPTLSKSEANKTPRAFADVLINLAIHSKAVRS